MPADSFAVQGSYTTTPQTGSSSGAPAFSAILDESQVLLHKEFTTTDLTVDTPVTIPFGGVINATVIALKTVGGKVRARLTSADGSVQAIPVDSFALILSLSVPYTAVDVTRVAGQFTTVHAFIGSNQ